MGQPMHILRDVSALHAWRRALPPAVRVGFVPTMGNLHEGHLALVSAAQAVSDRVIVSIFVNPLQFTDAADLARYPRTEDADLAALAAAGVDAVFLPTVDGLFPENAPSVGIAPGSLADRWEGVARPGHFAGMATIVAKLFHLVAPTVAVFGQKDFQQLRIVQAMVRALDFPVEILAEPTHRAADGLALSSRNRFLTAEERNRAPRLLHQLQDTADRLRMSSSADAACIDSVLTEAMQSLVDAGFGVDYFALCAVDTLAPTHRVEQSVLLAAVRLGTVRLLDNMLL